MIAGSGWPKPDEGWPSWTWTVPYVGEFHPAANWLPPTENGANCQRFAYAVLALFSVSVPPVRSAELWADTTVTASIADDDLTPLDLVMFNSAAVAWGAHVGVFMAEDQILHLCAEVGKPATWSMDDFSVRPRYATRIGAKRVDPDPTRLQPTNEL